MCWKLWELIHFQQHVGKILTWLLAIVSLSHYLQVKKPPFFISDDTAS